MKKAMFFLACTLLSFTYTNAQTIIEGTVYTGKKVPMEGASVYLNNSTIGTTTDVNGNFELNIGPGTFELIVSFIGYKTIVYGIDASTYEKPLSFKLLRATNFLDEAVVRKTKYDSDWRYNLNRFKSAFLGRTTLSSQCKLLNPKALSFEYDRRTGILTAFAKEPLKIENNGLGYLITYDLVHFALERQKVTYLGLTKYQDLKGAKSKQRKWKKKRRKAYNGSLMHFVRALRAENLKSEGFLVHQFKRVANAERPSEKEIKKARAYIASASSRKRPVNFSKKIENPQTPLDSAIAIVQKVKLPKYRDYLYKSNVPDKDLIIKNEKDILLSFENYLSIVYTKEPEEINYRPNDRRGKNQTSSITMFKKTAILDPSGMVIDPLDIFAEGYWSYEQFANLLPLDYQPKKN